MLIVIKASLRIVILDWLKAQIFYKIRKQFQYLKKIVELQTKVKSSPQPQVRNLNC